MPKLQIKICGITRKEDAALAANLGAWALGFLQWAPSPRFVPAPQIPALTKGLPPGIWRVGVFVNPTLEEVVASVTDGALSAIQLHGDESPEFCDGVRARFPGLPLIKAIRDPSAPPYGRHVDYLLLDAPKSGVADWGGTGKLADWSLARHLDSPFILSGGLRAENLALAVQATRAMMVDVSSGVESAPGQPGQPGQKDAEVLRQFFKVAAGLGDLVN